MIHFIFLELLEQYNKLSIDYFLKECLLIKIISHKMVCN